jgi:hypothetical protein
MSNPTITIPFTQATKAFGSVLPHASKDPVTPIITYVGVTPIPDEEGKSYVVATDRYSVGRYTINAVVDQPDDAPMFAVTRPVAEYISKLTPAGLRYGKTVLSPYGIRITKFAESSSILVEVLYDDNVEKSQAFDTTIAANFPPVLRLFPDLDDEKARGVDAVALSTSILTKAIASHKFAADDKNDAITFHLFHSPNGKPAPVYAKVGMCEMLLQPNLLLR